MRLINAATLGLEDFFLKSKPKYAILSHRWDVDEEISYHEMLSTSSPSKGGWQKIRNTCSLALRNDLHYVWIGTCCIDKSSSAELSEAINSMFSWYQEAEECYAILSDLLPDDHARLMECCWWTRGWTLQELIAPRQLSFFDTAWNLIGLREDFCDVISISTKIPKNVLGGEADLRHTSVAARMSWASRRSTTRKEDEAYCLLGLFDISMPLIYGEGEKAFRRLQEEIIKRSDDLTIFTGTGRLGAQGQLLDDGILATSPRAFEAYSDCLVPDRYAYHPCEFALTNLGLRFTGQVELTMVETQMADKQKRILYALELGHPRVAPNKEKYCVCLEKVGPAVFRLHPIFHGTIVTTSSAVRSVRCFEFMGWIFERNICVLGRGSITPPRKTPHFSATNSVHIPKSSNVDMKVVGPQLFWDSERRTQTDRFDYDFPLYFIRVNIALMGLKLSQNVVRVAVYWWAMEDDDEPCGQRLTISLLDARQFPNRIRRFLDRNRFNSIYIDDFTGLFHIEEHLGPSAELSFPGGFASVQVRLVPVGETSYDLKFDIEEHKDDEPKPEGIDNGSSKPIVRTTNPMSNPAHGSSKTYGITWRHV